jgi:hypothetical protein
MSIIISISVHSHRVFVNILDQSLQQILQQIHYNLLRRQSKLVTFRRCTSSKLDYFDTSLFTILCYRLYSTYYGCSIQAWAWVEWKEGNLDVARELFQGAIAVDPRSMDAVRSFQVYFLPYFLPCSFVLFLL